ncbi:hypothetical protein COT51_03325 [candidate division WWE3 bacterium CG08_land_8_20_14_0_20_41_15]|uniref:Uncharacterized protein n=1 Tax=candidate division WWE3 bacterium CG08_land_8_20_14_0_20_41_15 TaxID=1975086 RepID=A0A2H0X8S4_UNCKA|nr:MAG: hypothetical protein COT51_03325 [candidate division WWE3 bacterium CG08_land_8_20_14_0_20_41_15]
MYGFNQTKIIKVRRIINIEYSGGVMVVDFDFEEKTVQIQMIEFIKVIPPFSLVESARPQLIPNRIAKGKRCLGNLI